MRRFHESFDGLTPTQLGSTGKWASVGSGVVSVTGRTLLGVTGTSGASQADNTLKTRLLHPATTNIGYHGFATKHLTLPASEQPIWGLLADDGSRQLTITIATNGTVRVYRGSMETGTLLGDSALTFVSTSAYRYLEIGYRLDVGGRVEVRSIPASGTARQLVVMGGTSTRAWAQAELYLTDQIIVDDYYVNDASLTPSFFSGDSTIEILYPVDVSREFDLSLVGTFLFKPNTGPNTAAGKVAAVDDDPLDGDATYIYTRKGFTMIEFQMEELYPDDDRQVSDVQLVALCRRTSTTSPTAPTVGALGMRRWDGVDLSIKDPPNDDTIDGTVYQAMLGCTHQPGWTIERVNQSRFYFKT